MKNVIVYNQVNTDYHVGEKYTDEHLIDYLMCQIDNSLKLGWDRDDIIIGTNFDFEYRGIKNYLLEDVCTYSGFNNFWYGALELMNKGILVEDFWLHDQDSWPVRKFDFPDFDGEIAGCEYIKTRQWNCGSIFFKETSKFLLENIVYSMKNNTGQKISSDENWIAAFRFNTLSKNRHLFSSIDTRYNVGYTHFNQRYDRATKPINVFSFKPDHECFDVFESFINEDLLDIFRKHNLLSNRWRPIGWETIK